ncbi:hypothetical protein FRX31_027173 [Thalictrum thalictroides]|uniref:Uncharacterized protein n=1 Tax=Thalictrum thalictroides TaxID=46969 RepID=A0A7J6VF44_THATH|nr:hypothetical protein FRX31_027173 [Thalictrum thalictroides]
MVNARFPAMLPRKVLVQDDDKSFQIEWLRQASKGEKVDLMERSKGGTFMVRISVEGERWLGSLLCQISMGITLLGTTFRKNEPNRGDFLKFVVFIRSTGKFRTIYFPVGFKGQVWSLLGS